MNNYVVSIGGTGSKTAESIIHICAAGMVPGERLKILFVDPDTANGSLERAQITMQQYINCWENLETGKIDLFKTNIETYNPNIWTPFETTSQPRLDNFFQYSTLKARNPSIASLFDVLYSKSEKETPLDKGFRGRPSIGAAVMAKTIELGKTEPWKTFFEEVKNDTNGIGARIFLIGSIFGGTGASGFPTIAKLIHNGLENRANIKIGGALILPYFSFIPNDQEKLKATSENFLITTKVALDYYYANDVSRYFDSIYLLGNESPTDVTFGIGGKDQKNCQHFIELYAALAAADFFGTNRYGFCEVARCFGNNLDWGDLPDGNNGNTVKQRIGQLTRFAFAYLSVYEQMLDIIHKTKGEYRAPWFVNFFVRKEDTDINDSKLQLSLRQLKDYCISFLEWIANIQTSAKNEDINLVKYKIFAEDNEKVCRILQPNNFTFTEFENLVLSEGKKSSQSISQLWQNMCDTKVEAKVTDSEIKGVGRFIHALYNECI
jgi:hypothetical protein